MFTYIRFNSYRELNSFEEPCFTLVATISSLARELNPTGVGEHIYCHPQIDCFVLPELFSVARQARFPKPGSKHSWLKRQSKILPLSHEESTHTHVYIYIYIYIYIHIFIYIYIYIYRAGSTDKMIYIYIYHHHIALVARIKWYIYIYIYIYIYVCVCVWIYQPHHTSKYVI